MSVRHTSPGRAGGERSARWLGAMGQRMAPIRRPWTKAALLRGPQALHAQQSCHPLPSAGLPGAAHGHGEPRAAVLAPARLENFPLTLAPGRALSRARGRSAFFCASRKPLRLTPGARQCALTGNSLDKLLITLCLRAGLPRPWRVLLLGSSVVGTVPRARGAAPGSRVRVPAAR